MSQIEALGISTQRATFTTWDRRTGVPFHNFISWQDQRAADLVRSWNRSCTMKIIHSLMRVVYFLTGQKRFLAASLIVFTTQHVTLRLVWALTHHKQVCRAVSAGTCCFGTIDTWLLFRLTKGAVHATDYSNASSTGLFDTYQMCWSSFLCSLVSLPLSIFPEVENTGRDFGSTDPSIFGASIPIMSVMADQQAAMFGEGCFDVGDVKITMGTGTFMDIHTGNKPHTSIAGRGRHAFTQMPVVPFSMSSPLQACTRWWDGRSGRSWCTWRRETPPTPERPSNGPTSWSFSRTCRRPAAWPTASAAPMACASSRPSAACRCPNGFSPWFFRRFLLSSVFSETWVSLFSSSAFLYELTFAPLNDPKACASFMGLKPSTTKSHLVRAILESVAFRNKQLYETMLRETHIPITKIRVDGGVSANDFVMQLTADLFGEKLIRPQHREMSCLGAALVAGLGAGFWRTREELKKLKKLQSPDKVFLPRGGSGGGGPPPDWENSPALRSWERALRRSMNWYKP